MPVLTAGTALRSRSPTVTVENQLAAGSWRFRLTVVDDSGNESDPAELVVRVADVRPPTPPTGPVVGPVRPIDPVVLRDPVRPVPPVPPIRGPG